MSYLLRWIPSQKHHFEKLTQGTHTPVSLWARVPPQMIGRILPFINPHGSLTVDAFLVWKENQVKHIETRLIEVEILPNLQISFWVFQEKSLESRGISIEIMKREILSLQNELKVDGYQSKSCPIVGFLLISKMKNQWESKLISIQILTNLLISSMFYNGGSNESRSTWIRNWPPWTSTQDGVFIWRTVAELSP